MSIEEQGIFHTQAKAAREQLGDKDGLRELQQRSAVYQDERIIVYLLAAAAIGLCVVWATASSGLVLYGSLGLVIGLTILWGLARIKTIERTRRERALAAAEFERLAGANEEISENRS
jgi:hypothetical protein